MLIRYLEFVIPATFNQILNTLFMQGSVSIIIANAVRTVSRFDNCFRFWELNRFHIPVLQLSKSELITFVGWYSYNEFTNIYHATLRSNGIYIYIMWYKWEGLVWDKNLNLFKTVLHAKNHFKYLTWFKHFPLRLDIVKNYINPSRWGLTLILWWVTVLHEV